MTDEYTNIDPTSLMPSLNLGPGFYTAMIVTTILFIIFILYSLYLFMRIIKAIEAVIRLDKNVQKIVSELEAQKQPKTPDNPQEIRAA